MIKEGKGRMRREGKGREGNDRRAREVRKWLTRVQTIIKKDEKIIQ